MTPNIAVPHWRAPTAERTRYYYDSLEEAGARAIIAVEPTLPADATGLLLTGGVDVDPVLYGDQPGPKTQRPNKARDVHELKLLGQALSRDLPVLAICRGHQLINVALGGSLVQDIEGSDHRSDDGVASHWHGVSILNGRLGALFGTRKTLRVNSRHHQGIRDQGLAESLAPAAYSPDGLVEAVESREHRWVMGVQWHPERPEMHATAIPLFAAFVAACRE